MPDSEWCIALGQMTPTIIICRVTKSKSSPPKKIPDQKSTSRSVKTHQDLTPVQLPVTNGSLDEEKKGIRGGFSRFQLPMGELQGRSFPKCIRNGNRRTLCIARGSQHGVSTKSAQQISALHSIPASGLCGWSLSL